MNMKLTKISLMAAYTHTILLAEYNQITELYTNKILFLGSNRLAVDCVESDLNCSNLFGLNVNTQEKLSPHLSHHLESSCSYK